MSLRFRKGAGAAILRFAAYRSRSGPTYRFEQVTTATRGPWDAVTDNPALILQNRYDPATPYEGAVEPFDIIDENGEPVSVEANVIYDAVILDIIEVPLE